MEMETLLAKVQEHYAHGLPFVLYSLPESNEIAALFQKNKKKYTSKDFSEDGFVLAPFVEGDSLLIPDAQSESLTIPYSELIKSQSLINLAEDDQEKKD